MESLKPHKRFDPRPYLAPVHWPVWLGVGLLWLLVHLPYRIQLPLGGLVGRLLYHGLPSRRRVGLINLELAFPELEPAQRVALLKRHFRALGMGILEMGMGWWRDPRWLQRICQVDGLHHIEGAQRAGHGVLLVFPHFTAFELGALTLASHRPVSALFAESRNVLFRALLDHFRLRLVEETVPAQDVRRCVRLLRSGRVLFYLPDQAAKLSRGGVLAPFFGREVLTTPGTSRLAALGRAVVIPIFPRRLPGTAGYRVECWPPLDDFPSGDPVADTCRINAVFEDQIRAAPEQYLWVHERFKRGAPGSPSPYR